MTVLLILAIISAMIALANFLPITFDICLYSGGQRIYLKYGIFRFKLNGRKKKKKQKAKITREEHGQNHRAAASAKKKKDDQKRSLTDSLRLAMDFLAPLPKIVAYLTRGIRVEKLELYLSVAEEDAAKTATRYGQYCAGVSAFLPMIKNIFPLEVKAIKIIPNFSMAQTRYYTRFFVSVRFYRAVLSSLRYLAALFKEIVVKK